MKDISKKDFDGWKKQLATQAFFRFLLDERQALMESWATGQEDEEAQIACKIYGEIPLIEYDEIMALYDTAKEEKKIVKE